MKTKTKRIWLALTLVIVFAAAAGLLWKKEPPQIIVLPDNLKVQFVGVTYGTNHLQPGVLARLVSKLPSSTTNLVRQVLGKRLGPITSFQTPQASLCLWFKYVGTNHSRNDLTFDAKLTNEQGSFTADARWINFQNDPWQYAVFQGVPRHSLELQCVLYSQIWGGDLFPKGEEVGRVSFRNPFYSKAE